MNYACVISIMLVDEDGKTTEEKYIPCTAEDGEHVLEYLLRGENDDNN